MKTIKDAVIELEGKLPAEKEKVNGWTVYNGNVFYLWALSKPIAFSIREFEVTAKRLGYINGYRWGIEYPTNGKRPDLPDDVVVYGRNHGDECGKCDHVKDFFWNDYFKFRITDQRYKPVEDISEISESKPDAEAVSEKPESNWYERGELPPVGWVGELSPYWHTCEVVAHHNGAAVVWDAHDLKYISIKNTTLFRPIRTEREKVIEAAAKGLGELCPLPDVLNSLYDAGMLVLPPKKSDTKD